MDSFTGVYTYVKIVSNCLHSISIGYWIQLYFIKAIKINSWGVYPKVQNRITLKMKKIWEKSKNI